MIQETAVCFESITWIFYAYTQESLHMYVYIPRGIIDFGILLKYLIIFGSKFDFLYILRENILLINLCLVFNLGRTFYVIMVHRDLVNLTNVLPFLI